MKKHYLFLLAYFVLSTIFKILASLFNTEATAFEAVLTGFVCYILIYKILSI